MDLVAHFNARLPPHSRHLGMVFTEISPDRVVARMDITADHGNGAEVLHGGAAMAFADTLGAVATVVNMPRGSRTTTMESKTNFVSPAPVGQTVTGEATPIHRGRQTQVWQTRILREDGKLVALVTQTQLVFPPKSEEATA